MNSNSAKPINSVLILGYHNIDNNQTTSKDTMDIALFEKEMKYLYDNGVRVMTMSDLGYDENSKCLYVKNNTKWNDKMKTTIVETIWNIA